MLSFFAPCLSVASPAQNRLQFELTQVHFHTRLPWFQHTPLLSSGGDVILFPHLGLFSDFCLFSTICGGILKGIGFLLGKGKLYIGPIIGHLGTLVVDIETAVLG